MTKSSSPKTNTKSSSPSPPQSGENGLSLPDVYSNIKEYSTQEMDEDMMNENFDIVND